MSNLRRVGLTAAVLMLIACGQESADPAADEAAIRAAVAEWAAAARAKDAAAFASFYADDAVLMLEGSADVSGKTAIREAIGLFPTLAPPFAAMLQATESAS